MVLFLWRTLTNIPSYKLLSSCLNRREVEGMEGAVSSRQGSVMITRKKDATSVDFMLLPWEKKAGMQDQVSSLL